jgi:hypothetical protein
VILEKDGDDGFDRRVGNEEELQGVKEDRNILHTVVRREAN